MNLDDDTVADLLDLGRTATELAATEVDAYIGRFARDGLTAAQQAQAFVLCRCLADIRAGALLSTSCYPSQIASVLRSTHESLCVVKMLHHEPEEAETWWKGEKRYSVREIRRRARLPEEHPFDDLYSCLCGISHSRSEGIDTQYTMTSPETGLVSTGPVFYSNSRVADAGYLVVSTLVEVVDGFLDHFPRIEAAPPFEEVVQRVRRLARQSIVAYAQAFTKRDPERLDEMRELLALVREW